MRGSETRREKQHAEERIQLKLQHPDLLLDYTNFIDKKTMLIKRKLVPGLARRDLEETFNPLEEMRNRCAHPESTDESFIEEPRQLLKYVRACHRVLSKLNDALEQQTEKG